MTYKGYNSGWEEGRKKLLKEIIKEIRGMKLKMTKEEKKLAKEIGCLIRCDDQELFYNQAIDDIILNLNHD
jgi:hypothetical protein